MGLRSWSRFTDVWVFAPLASVRCGGGGDAAVSTSGATAGSTTSGSSDDASSGSSGGFSPDASVNSTPDAGAPTDSSAPTFPVSDASCTQGVSDETISSNGSWCYVNPMAYKSAASIISELDTINARGGMMLLNISPMSDGSIPPEQVAILNAVGKHLGAPGNF